MIYKIFKHVLLGFALLASLSAGAQDFDSELQLSNNGVIYWYRICSALPGMEGYAMTDLNGAVDGEDQEDVLRFAVCMIPTETGDYRSQWKLTAGEDGRVILTNRATGSQISNHSGGNGNHNVTWLTSSGDAPGFTVTALGDDAFKLESVEDDGVNRCLAMADKDGEALTYPESGESTSFVGWKFLPVEIDTGIGSMKAGRMVVRVAGKHITVSNCSDWQLFNAQGEQMPRTIALPTGVYMVKLPQGTVKIAIP
ncbi:MAG: RICIN domain-containing protein [Bacteroidaceae bacterium]|nr:RICIN domain-containing protein [Bacteroidaceae bacterium]